MFEITHFMQRQKRAPVTINFTLLTFRHGIPQELQCLVSLLKLLYPAPTRQNTHPILAIVILAHFQNLNTTKTRIRDNPTITQLVHSISCKNHIRRSLTLNLKSDGPCPRMVVSFFLFVLSVTYIYYINTFYIVYMYVETQKRRTKQPYLALG